MKPLKLFVAIAVAAIFLSSVARGFGVESHEVISEVAPHGCINWSQGIVYTKEIRKKPAGTHGDALVHRAKADTYADLFETVKGIRIDSCSLVKDLLEKSDMVRVQLQGMVEGAEIVKREYLSDGTVEAILGFKMTGAFAQLALPEDVKQVPQIRTITRKPAEEEKAGQEEGPSLSSNAGEYTGLVVDARELGGRPAMVPRIIDEDGHEVYGPAFVSREFAVQQRVATYERDLQSALDNPRVSDNPLTVKGLRTGAAGQCNFVISNADALKIQSTSENLLFLKKCKVIIVLD